MAQESCPLPGTVSPKESGAIERMLEVRRIAVVGLSDDPDRPSFEVAAYLQQQGYQIVPVNPKCREVLGNPCVASLDQLDRPADVVLVFRRSEHCAEVAREAVAAKSKGLWLQQGIRNDEAKQMAEQAGIPFVQDRCMKIEHMRRGREAGC